MPMLDLFRLLRLFFFIFFWLLFSWPTHSSPTGSYGLYNPRPASYGIGVEKDVRLTMRDGVDIYFDIYYPTDENGQWSSGQFPTIVTMTPYNKNLVGTDGSRGTGFSPYLVERGYIHLVADIRGTGSSEGVWFLLDPLTGKDGYELVEWAATQSWSNGKVGMFGESYLGITQYYVAMEQPPHLRAIAPRLANPEPGRGCNAGGQLCTSYFVPFIVPLLGSVPPNYLIEDPIVAVLVLLGKLPGVAIEALSTIGRFSGDDRSYSGSNYWTWRSGLHNVDRIKVPVLLSDNWWDGPDIGTVLKMFRALQNRNIPVKLIMGNGYHEPPRGGLVPYGIPSLEQIELAWFDQYLLGNNDKALRDFGPFVYYSHFEDRYYQADTWPVTGKGNNKIQANAYYLSGSPQIGLGGGTLTTSNNDVLFGADQLPWWPVSGVCTRTRFLLAGDVDDLECAQDSQLNDMTGLVYDLPDAGGLRVNGPMALRLFVSTTGSNAFISTRVEAVAPDGTSHEIAVGADTLSRRAIYSAESIYLDDYIIYPWHPETVESELPVEPGKIYEWWVRINPSAFEIPADYRLRLVLHSSDIATLVPTLPQFQAMAGSVITIYHDFIHPSALILPVESNAIGIESGDEGLTLLP